jgi:hypothetical protein
MNIIENKILENFSKDKWYYPIIVIIITNQIITTSIFLGITGIFYYFGGNFLQKVYDYLIFKISTNFTIENTETEYYNWLLEWMTHQGKENI